MNYLRFTEDYSPIKKPSKSFLMNFYRNYQRPVKYALVLIFIWFFTKTLVTKNPQNVNDFKKILNFAPAAMKINKNGVQFAENGTIYLPDGIILHDGRTEKIKRFINELNLTNPGAGGEDVWPDQKLLTEEHKKLIKEGFDEFGCNTFISDMVGLNRFIVDNRSDYCKAKIYDNSKYPKISVVIAFHNDPWSVLLRTVHSVLINTPPHLLEEIVLSDDYSTSEDLGQKLDDYIKTLKKVKVIRSHKRMGVVGARVLGFRNSRGPVIVSLDSHVEVTSNWSEPMLDRIKDNPNLLVWPQIHGSDKNSFGIGGYDGSVSPIGGLDFMMNFVSQRKIYKRNSSIDEHEPWKSPTLYGPTFMIWKKFFEHIGYMDYDFDIWGGDDVELGLKVWMCGGSIELVPCSVTIHLYRDHKYSKKTQGKGGYQWNTDRIAETWLDDNYKKYYYRSVGDTKNRNYGDISDRLALKEKIGCKNFTWFVENVHPELGKIPKYLSDEEWAKKKTMKSLLYSIS